MEDKSTILQVFYGNEGNSENIHITHQIARLIDKLDKIEKEFKKLIESDSKAVELYEKLTKLQTEINVEQENLFYKEGFKMGVRTTAEAML